MTYSYGCTVEREDDEGNVYHLHFRFEMDIDPPEKGRSGKYHEDCEPAYDGKADISEAYLVVTNEDGTQSEVDVTKRLSEFLVKSEISDIEEAALDAWKNNDNYNVPEKDYSYCFSREIDFLNVVGVSAK
jgi:hypothetical protein